MIIEILEFISQDIKHFFGTIVLIGVISHGLAKIIHGEKSGD